MDLKGKVALINGASSGIGRDIAIGLAKEGCKLVIVGTSENRLKEVENEIKKNRSQVLLLIADLNKKESIDLIIKKTLKVFKKINIIINNAGVLFDSDFLDITEEQWDITLNVNLKAAFLLSQKVLSIMKAKWWIYYKHIFNCGIGGTSRYSCLRYIQTWFSRFIQCFI